MRKIDFARKTGETDIKGMLNLDGQGRYNVKTGCVFFDNMQQKGDVEMKNHTCLCRSRTACRRVKCKHFTLI